MPRRKHLVGAVKSQTLYIGGLALTVPAQPFCDCDHPAMGFTKRYDGAWVRPCCMRRTQQAYAKHGDGPIKQGV